MPRVPAHLVKSAIRLERQSTTVPNTSNTSAFTAEISDMFDPFQTSSFRDGPKDQTRNLEIPGSLATLAPRNDGKSSQHLAVLDESEMVGNLIVKCARLRVARLCQPIHPARTRRLGLLVHRFDQRASPRTATHTFRDEQILKIAVPLGSPGRAMEQ